VRRDRVDAVAGGERRRGVSDGAAGGGDSVDASVVDEAGADLMTGITGAADVVNVDATAVVGEAAGGAGLDDFACVGDAVSLAGTPLVSSSVLPTEIVSVESSTQSIKHCDEQSRQTVRQKKSSVYRLWLSGLRRHEHQMKQNLESRAVKSLKMMK